MAADLDVSVVIPAFNAERTVGRVVEALRAQDPAPAEIVVVDDGSGDRTGEIAAAAGARIVRNDPPRHAGGARNAGWEAATRTVVVFLDADAIPAPGWGAGLARALEEFPHSLIGCARTFDSRTAWGWVAHLQGETPYLPLGEPRRVTFLSSYCVAVPRDVPFRWDESYGGEDGVFCADATAAGYGLVFDPRFHAHHDHDRETWSATSAASSGAPPTGSSARGASSTRAACAGSSRASPSTTSCCCDCRSSTGGSRPSPS